MVGQDCKTSATYLLSSPSKRITMFRGIASFLVHGNFSASLFFFFPDPAVFVLFSFSTYLSPPLLSFLSLFSPLFERSLQQTIATQQLQQGVSTFFKNHLFPVGMFNTKKTKSGHPQILEDKESGQGKGHCLLSRWIFHPLL